MSFNKEPSVRKVKVAKAKTGEFEEEEPQETSKYPDDEEPKEPPEEEPDPLFVKGAKEPPSRPKVPGRGPLISKKPEPDLEDIVLAETRVAKPTDEKRKKRDDDDPAERLGMSKIGVLPKGAPLEGPKKEETPEEEPPVPEPIIEEAIQDDTVEEQPKGRLPPPPIPPGAKEVKPPSDHLTQDLPGKEPEVEYEEVEIGRDGRKMKIMRLKPSKLPPAPVGDEGPEPMHAGPGGSGGIKDLSEVHIERLPPGKRIRRDAGLGLEVELDDEAIRKLSAPVLPAEFAYPNRAFHGRFRRYVLFMILPVLFIFIMFILNILNMVMLLLVVMMFIVLLAALYIYGISPFYTGHTVTKTRIILKHGVYFEARVPIDDIRTVQVYEGRAGMMGIRLDRDHRLYVISDRKEMVEIVLRTAMTVAGRKGVESIITNVERPAFFVSAVKSAQTARAQERLGEDI
jgi:hypothetical protein